LPLDEGKGRQVHGFVAGQQAQYEGSAEVEWLEDAPYGYAPILTPEVYFELGELGDFDRTQPFAIALWVFAPTNHTGTATVLGRVTDESDPARSHSGWEVLLQEDTLAFRLSHTERSGTLKVRAGQAKVRDGAWHHLAISYGGTRHPDGVTMYVDGVEQKLSTDEDRLEFTTRVAVPLQLGRRSDGQPCNGVGVQDLRLFGRRLDEYEVRALAYAPRAAGLLAKPRGILTSVELDGLLGVYLAAERPDWTEATRRWMELETERDTIRGRSPVTQVQEERTEESAFAHILHRGQYDQPREKVTADTFAVLPRMSRELPKNRLGLAKWLVEPDNPLPARVTVNRFWQELFGTGLVRTSEDFGVMGEPPVNQELLDWLAVEFIESGWDVRHMFRLMVSSATYRQSAMTTPEKLEVDPQNRWLSRGPRFRMDAEMVRDYALSAGDLLEPIIGGPSVRPYQPAGVWEAVAMPESNTRFYRTEAGPALYRRSLYTFWKRAAPPASMDVLNAPSRETCTVRRERTNTPLQALATLNDVQLMEAARHVAANALASCDGQVEGAVEEVARRILVRPLHAAERSIFADQMRRFVSYYSSHHEDARLLLAAGETPPASGGPAADLAALTMLANQLLNLDEVLTK
jgi:hypothetical protein